MDPIRGAGQEMARKKTKFQWEHGQPGTPGLPPEPPNFDDVDESELYPDGTDEAGRLDRTAHREEMAELKALAIRLAALPAAFRATLPLEEETLEALDRLAHADRTPARRRLVMRARLLLGGEDLIRLDAALAGDTPAAALERALIDWRTRILAGDDSVLQAFLAEYPRGDRQVLRTCVREARGTDDAGRRANKSLLKLLRAAALMTAEES